MPTYDFKNIETDEVKEYFMSHTELDEFKKANPKLQQVISSANFISAQDGAVLKKAGDGWKEVQDRIKSGMPPKDRGLINTK